jgi:hypothetical protein
MTIGLALFLLMIGAAVAVGFAARGRGFDWDVASVAGTAVGTSLLAVGTLALAYTTWQDVRASQRIADDTRRSLQLAEEDRRDRLRPAVIGAATGLAGDAEGVFLSVEVHNIGGGAAMRVEVTAEYSGPWDLSVQTTTIPVIVSGGSFPLAVRLDDVNLEDREFLNLDEFSVRGKYLDRRARRVPLRIIDWRHDELPETGYPE